jgi:serine phosphatase RsbU (regulator of sigma subunit)
MQDTQKDNVIRRFYNFFSKDLSSSEFEKVFLRDTPARYKYLVRSMSKGGDKEEGHGVLTFMKNFAVTFLSKLSPVIRIIYAATALYFFVGMIQGSWEMGLFAFVVVNLLFMFEVADKLTMRDELQIARDVQAGLIPSSIPESEDFSLAFYYETANEVGGDFFDYISKDGKDIYMVGDVSGKGMSAALYMVQARLLIRYLVEKSESFSQVLTGVNEALLKNLKKGFFFTSIFAIADGKNLRLVRAGHNPALFYSSSTRECTEMKQNGMGLGLTNGTMFRNSIEELSLTPESGDIVLLFSDGLTEAMNSQSEEFGLQRLRGLLVRHSNDSATQIADEIIKEVKKFRGYAEIHDDITFILLKKN